MTFYVYVDYTLEESPRPFYVGKDNEDRVNLVKRNSRHAATAEAYGMCREVVVLTRLNERCWNTKLN